MIAYSAIEKIMLHPVYLSIFDNDSLRLNPNSHEMAFAVSYNMVPISWSLKNRNSNYR